MPVVELHKASILPTVYTAQMLLQLRWHVISLRYYQIISGVGCERKVTIHCSTAGPLYHSSFVRRMISRPAKFSLAYPGLRECRYIMQLWKPD